MSNNKNHDEHIRKIALSSKVIGLEGIALSSTETNMFSKNKLLGQPDDLLFDSNNHIIYNIEYKSHHNNNKRHYAKIQLRRANEFLNSIFPSYKTINLYVHDNYRIEEIK